jgi:tol-pal system protein YbgF
MKIRKILLLVCFILLFTVGCIPLSSQNFEILKGDVAQLEIQYRELQQNYADLLKKFDSYCIKIDLLDALVRDLRLASVDKAKPGDNETDVEALSLYQSAYADFSIGKFNLAYSGFQSFVNNYPKTNLAAEAQFYMGECLYSCNMWEKAIEEYNRVEQNYLNSKLVPSARFKEALCYESLGKTAKTNSILLSILEDFPQSYESLTAKKKINLEAIKQ